MTDCDIALHDMTFAYRRNAVPVLTDVSAEFHKGSITVLTGASGSGKSTLLYILALMLRTMRGSVMWRGSSVSQLSDHDRARIRAQHMGFVFQDAMLDPARPVLDNVLEGGLFAGMDRADAAASAAELLEELGVSARRDHRPGEISGGQAQRVGLCRALVNEPTVIFADEPTGNLDERSARVVWRVLEDRADRGATVIVATHDLSLASAADKRLEL